MEILLAAQAFDTRLLSDVKFYVILALLAAALIAIIVIFSRWESFKMKKKDDSDKSKYVRPTIIKVDNEHKK
ncbi:MAG: hypothetical protein K5923_01120 [Clostridia bacterium]|jgi:hypothetical protein|nr:hypothetical protein [Clostridia bacterium]